MYLLSVFLSSNLFPILPRFSAQKLMQYSHQLLRVVCCVVFLWLSHPHQWASSAPTYHPPSPQLPGRRLVSCNLNNSSQTYLHWSHCKCQCQFVGVVCLMTVDQAGEEDGPRWSRAEHDEWTAQMQNNCQRQLWSEKCWNHCQEHRSSIAEIYFKIIIFCFGHSNKHVYIFLFKAEK